MPFEPNSLPYRDSVSGREVLDLSSTTPEVLMKILLEKVIPDYDWESEDVNDTPRRFVKMLQVLGLDILEYWKHSTTWPNFEVSFDGRIRNAKTKRLLRPWLAGGNEGYPKVGYAIRGVKNRHREVFVHKVVADAFFGPCPEGQIVRHGSLGSTSQAVWNLSYGTYADNQEDRIYDGTDHRGSKHYATKLNESIVAEILQKIELGGRTNTLAREYKVRPQTITDIKYRKTWKHVVV